MKTNSKDNVSRWLLFGLLGIPPVLLTYFYLLLHVGLGVPLKEMFYPALAFCAFIPAFSLGACWGTRARKRGNSAILFGVLGTFALLCGIEFTYFENRLSGASRASYGFTVVWAIGVTIAAYLMDRLIVANRRGSSQQ